MKIERIKKNHKKEIIIGAVITVCLISAITLVTTRAKYRVTQDIKLAKGTVNYKPYDFKIMAMYQENDSGSYTEINEMPPSGYVVNEEKSYCTVDNKTQVKGKIKTIDGNHVISNLQKSDKCYIWFDKKPITISDIIAANNPKTTTPTFANAATTDEGVYSASDGMYGGTSYYWRGAATTNHVIFANKCWRIIRINGDGSMRLIYNGSVSSGTCTGNGSNAGSVVLTGQAYNSSYDRSEYVGWTYSTGSQRTTSGTASNIKSQTDTWYNNNIGNNDSYKEKVADGKFCNDRNTGAGYTWSSQPSSTFYYAGYGRSGAKSSSSVTPTLSCANAGDVYILKAGAITADEVVMAGTRWNIENSNYYLYNGKHYWTMSPYSLYWNGSNRYASVFYVSGSDGMLSGGNNYTNVGWTGIGLRPVINLRSDVTFSFGNGTQSNPYVVQ